LLDCVKAPWPDIDTKGSPISLTNLWHESYDDAPEEDRSELRKIAVQKTLKLTAPENVEHMLENMQKTIHDS
jgi:hypothetical protein